MKQELPVTPALALPGWYVSQSDDVWRNSPVKVFTPMGEGANFMAKDIIRLDPTTVSYTHLTAVALFSDAAAEGVGAEAMVATAHA